MKAICDFCEGDSDSTDCELCSICGLRICFKHNFGGEYSRLLLEIYIYNSNIMDSAIERHNIINLCPNCLKAVQANPFTIPVYLAGLLEQEFSLWVSKLKIKSGIIGGIKFG